MLERLLEMRGGGKHMMAGKYRRVIRSMARERFPGEEKAILERACRQYDLFWKTTPDIGGRRNMQFKDLDFLIAFFSFYEACDRRIGIPELDVFAYEAVVKSSKAAGRMLSWNSPLMGKLARRMYAGYQRKIDKHLARGEWGNTWRVEMNPEGHKEGFAIHTRGCPNVDFCRAHGYEDFLPAICAQDYRIAAAMHGVLVRTHTVARGDAFCDWWYFGDRQELPEEAKRRLGERK